MGKIIELDAKPSKLSRSPADIWQLRWRLVLDSGVSICSSWLPETRYPSTSQTLKEFSGSIAMAYIDGKHRFEHQNATFLRVPGYMLANISYKAMVSYVSGRQAVVGIEMEDIEGRRYLILRDGTAYTEERTEHVANNY